MNKEPTVHVSTVGLNDGSVAGETVVIQEEMPSDRELAAVAAHAFMDMAKLSEAGEKEFLKIVVNEYKERKEYAKYMGQTNE